MNINTCIRSPAHALHQHSPISPPFLDEHEQNMNHIQLNVDNGNDLTGLFHPRGGQVTKLDNK